MRWHKKGLALVLCAVMALSFSLVVCGTEVQDEAAAVATENLTAEQAMSLVKNVGNHLTVFGRYEEITPWTLYETAVKRLLEEDPALYHTVLKAMLASVDEHSEYYTAKEAVSFAETVSGEISGIGITIDFHGGAAATVASVIPGTPAEKAGLQVGDVLLRANGVDLRNMKSETLLSHVRGEVGTTIRLEVERNGAILAFEMVREAIIGTSVEHALYEEDGEKVLYIRVYGFLSNTAEKFREALEEGKKKNVKKLILDLRDNGGGILDQAIAMADCFVPKGAVITTEDHKNSIFNKVYVGTAAEKYKYETILLMNENSASASEVFAAALRQNDLAVILGTTSYGKGTIQSISSLQTGGAIKYTSGYYLTPNGENINGVGLIPDIGVKNSFEEMKADHFGKFGYVKVYKEGDFGEEVLLAKKILEFFGLYQGEMNDVYDKDLYYAVYAFQQQAKLHPYGVLDLTTQQQLHNHLGISKKEHDDQLRAALACFGIQIEE